MAVWCDLCVYYHPDRFLYDHLGVIMTTPATPQSIQAIADQLTGVLPQVQSLVAGADLEPIATAAQAIVDALTPAEPAAS